MRRRGWGLALKRVSAAYGSSGEEYGYSMVLDALWVGKAREGWLGEETLAEEGETMRQ